MASLYPLSDDKITSGKIITVGFIFFNLVILTWYAINYPPLMEKAALYWWMALTFLVAFLLDQTFKIKSRLSEIIDTITYEKTFVKIPLKLLIPVLLITFMISFFIMSKTGYSVAAPTFQVVELGAYGDALYSFSAAVIEGAFFWAFLGPTLAGVVYALTRNPLLALLSMLIFTSPVFLIYHTFVYGFTDVLASAAVLIFGAEMVLMNCFVLRNLTWDWARHGGNNVGKAIFSQMTISTFFISIISNMWFWIILIFLIIIVFLKVRKGG